MAAAYKRAAAHAGSWYTDDPVALARLFEKWLAEAAADESVAVGVPAAGRLAGVICPHAGYRYSGPTASHSFMHVLAALRSASGIRRIFVLGPSHKVSLEGIAISGATLCSTPCGDLAVDQETVVGLLSALSGKIARRMTQREDENEHSIEMQLPFLAHAMAQARGAAWQSSATIVPIMIGRISGSVAGGSKVADVLAAALAPFLADTGNLFIISSDFCHWGDRFDFQPYASARDRERAAPEVRGAGSSGCPDIGDCIEYLDRTGMQVRYAAGVAVAVCSQCRVTYRHGLFTARRWLPATPHCS
jgi:AmmeMemoRadiSam system protein B